MLTPATWRSTAVCTPIATDIATSAALPAAPVSSGRSARSKLRHAATTSNAASRVSSTTGRSRLGARCVEIPTIVAPRMKATTATTERVARVGSPLPIAIPMRTRLPLWFAGKTPATRTKLTTSM
jgi:hypothetical protein